MNSEGKLTLNSSELSALTRLFSSAVFRELAKKGRSPLFARLLAQSNMPVGGDAHATVSDAFDVAFTALKTIGLRDEYIFRAALTKKILLGKHSLKTASMLNEFRAGSSKADLVILNGSATVYEIKSERDTLARLTQQVDDYLKVFATVNVITSETHVERVQAVVPDEVGILCLSRRHQISVIREGLDRPDRVCPVSVFESLRSEEAASILKSLGVGVTNVPNTQRHAMMKEQFASLRPADVHAQMVKTLKRTRNLSSLSNLVGKLPESLHAAALSVPIRRSEHERIVGAVATPLRLAFAWN